MNPETLNIILNINFKYDSNQTTRSEEDLKTIVSATVTDYNNNYLKVFSSVFRHSHFTSLVDASDDSILNNIKFGKENASNEEVFEAAKKASVHKNIIGFNKGYKTILGERGITLSGGQKQRVSIARAIIKDPQILLLDDCLSAVDTETEERILNNIDALLNDKTTIIVSHRISSAKNATKIIVLEEGKIMQQGTHNELIKLEGYYKELYAKQLLEKEN